MAFGSSVLTHKKEQQIKIAGEFKPTVDCLCATRRGFVAVYISCVPFLKISCLFWMFQPSQTANVQAIKAAGRSDICLKLEIIKKVIGVVLLLIAIQISPLAVAIINAVFAGSSAWCYFN